MVTALYNNFIGVVMKNKIFFVFVLILTSQAFADGQNEILKNNYFRWQLYNKTNINKDFSNLNPLFFIGDTGFFNNLPYIDTNMPISPKPKTITQNNTGNGVGWCGFFLLGSIYIAASLTESYAYPNNNHDKYRKEIWDKKIEEDELNRRIIRNY